MPGKTKQNDHYIQRPSTRSLPNKTLARLQQNKGGDKIITRQGLGQGYYLMRPGTRLLPKKLWDKKMK